MTNFKKLGISVLSVALVASMAGSVLSGAVSPLAKTNESVAANSYVSEITESIKSNREDYFSNDVIYKLPETVASEDDISVIVAMSTDTVLDAYGRTDGKESIGEFALSEEAGKVVQRAERKRETLVDVLDDSGINYEMGVSYDTILSGFEITIKAKDFDAVNALLYDSAALIVGETYESCQTEVVNNDVDVYETGIFDSSMSEYQGDGVVVAVLDTGLDYTHSAFSVDNFTTSQEAFTFNSISGAVAKTVAASYTSGLTGEDVYVSRKVPYAYDYADKDADVFPINSEHGTHVAGIIAGKDDTITGVAPNAQLAIMKVFSDSADGAKTSWILSALEDCVILGVDVINMSLGTACGFTREVDNERVNAIYDSIRDAGISLIASAANQYNATFGSEKNGSNGLTSNPDSGTVGSPSTYEAALSVASVDGVKTPYLIHNDDIIYFTEASTSAAKTKDFVDDILSTLGDNVQSHDFEYVTIPGVGRSSDYAEEPSYYSGKIVLVKRGTTTFEDKVRVALNEMGAAGIIIYNNVSGTISMSVGADIGAVCSISQDEGEALAAAGTGIIKISREQVAGPFMSDFSSWGPTSDLRIKPEITAHGGEILSAVPGQSYDRLSGTSMAAPNQSGATALIRQYVKYSGVFGNDLSTQEVTAIVNQLMMSTADIVNNKNGLPYAVRKQGAGLVNITKATTSASYITTYDRDGKAMDKTKLELGDDKNKTGVYEMKFDINNVSQSSVTYDIGAFVLTEGVSSTYTSHSDTTVTQDGYELSGSQTTVTSVTGGSQSGNKVTVEAKGTATVTVKIVLSDEDKKYLDESFAHGMYVEGFIRLEATSGTTVDMNIPFLAFYGGWTEAPIFDEEYYDTNADEINAGLDDEDKLMADAYATRVIGGLYTDYIATLGAYYFTQDPSATQIAADKKYIAISNQEDQTNATVNNIRYIYAGLLRNAKEVNITVTEDSTGKQIFNKTVYNQHKSYSSGSTVYPSSIDVDFSALENNLKNNTQYTVTVAAYIDYGEKEEQNNVRNTFEFPLFIDFEAPVVTDVTYRTEYDRTTKATKLYADIDVYDNHYAMALQVGQIALADPSTGYTFSMNTFGKYMTPVYSSFNSTSTVTIELTDYVAQLKESAGLDNSTVVYNNNSFIVTCYDYALNMATYEIRLPDEIMAMYFSEESISLSPNETKELSSVLNVYPASSWLEVLDVSSSDDEIADVVNQTIIAKKSGTAVITAVGYDADGNQVSASLNVKVLAEGEEGYNGSYSMPEVNQFTITGYTTNKAYYSVSSDDREIGLTGYDYVFNGDYSLSMYPSESVTLSYSLDSYYPSKTTLSYKVGNSKIATVDDNGTIVAQAKGNTIVTVSVMFDGKATLYSGRVSITVKDPFTTNSIYLMSYKGLGGEVTIPSDRGVTEIYTYAFSNYEYVDKDLENGDVIDDEDPYYIKQSPLGEDTITKIVIPEGVTTIQAYAFAKLTALEEVVLPSTLTRIGVGAFTGCENLKKINLESVKFINESAFSGCALEEIDLSSVYGVGDYAFEGCRLNYIELPATCQSLGIGAFFGNEYLTSVEFDAASVKIGSYVFAGCTQLTSIDVNAAVISSYAFYGCENLVSVTLGKDVSVIGEFAFYGTSVSAFRLSSKNTYLSLQTNGAMIYKGDELLLVAPCYAGTANSVTVSATSIATGAFAGNTKIFRVYADEAASVGAYAFAGCSNLQSVSLNSVTQIGNYAFADTALTNTPKLDNVASIGSYAFANTNITSVSVPDGATIGEYAFAYCIKLESVTIGNDVTIGAAAFYCPVNSYLYEDTQSIAHYTVYTYEVKDGEGNVVKTYSYYSYNFADGVYSKMNSLTIGENAVIGAYAFSGNAKLTSVALGAGASVGAYAFFNNAALKDIDLSGAKEIGAYAFAGSSTYDLCLVDNVLQYAYEREYIDGEETVVNYKYTRFAPSLAQIDLSGVSSLGTGAFAANQKLTAVSFGENLTEVPAYAFGYCESLESISLPDNIVSVDSYAFMGTSLTNIDLTDVSYIGGYAFARTPLTEVTLADGVVLDDGAFAYCYDLTMVNNIENISYIGGYAFYFTAITEAELTEAVYIGDFAFASSSLEKVTFGNKLKELGENPFFSCPIVTFGKESEVEFGGMVVSIEILETYDISDTVKVIDGVLYQTVPNGMELISYPAGKSNKIYSVEEGTVRIGARAFMGAALENVTLPSTLKSLGDKAFYGCENLSVVTFKGYEAPTLEEEYDTSYLTYYNLPITGSTGGYEGLGISDYYMWNITSRYNNFYFGANFVDYIGHIDSKIVMVRPANGQNYDTFIFSQYFDAIIEGANAATEETLKVIAMIDALPSNITLSCKEEVVAAREAYDKITSVEQQALVTNYETLSTAESIIAYLETRTDTEIPDIKPEPTEPSAFATFMKNNWIGLTIAGVAIVALVAYIIITRKKQNN